ncbi:MAG: hypothetical protein IKX42_12970 [Fibrobacter sp.]|nr:hypothetical protein [Fibrobacter sp.]
MKFFQIFALVLSAVLLQGCPYVAGGENHALEHITLDDLQGCWYTEETSDFSFTNTTYSNTYFMYCTKECIQDTLYYRETRLFFSRNNPPGFIPSPENLSWDLEKTDYDTAIVSVEPAKDGYFPYNYMQGDIPKKFDDLQKIKQDSKGWTLCKE